MGSIDDFCESQIKQLRQLENKYFNEEYIYRYIVGKIMILKKIINLCNSCKFGNTTRYGKHCNPCIFMLKNQNQFINNYKEREEK